MSKIAIVGFGGAGYCAAREIRQHDRISSIDVYSDTNVGPYNPMLTTYYVKGAIPYEALFPFGNLDEIEKELDLNFHADCPVTGLIPEKKELCFADGSKRSFDQILFSTGASAIMPPIPGIDLPGVIKMRTVQDAVHLKKILAEGTVKTALVIGASWVGIKVIEDLVENGVTSTLVDGAKWMFYVAAFAERSGGKGRKGFMWPDALADSAGSRWPVNRRDAERLPVYGGSCGGMHWYADERRILEGQRSEDWAGHSGGLPYVFQL